MDHLIKVSGIEIISTGSGNMLTYRTVIPMRDSGKTISCMAMVFIFGIITLESTKVSSNTTRSMTTGTLNTPLSKILLRISVHGRIINSMALFMSATGGNLWSTYYDVAKLLG